MICLGVDPAFGTVDRPETIESDAVKPMVYVIGMDNGITTPILFRSRKQPTIPMPNCLDLGVRDLTARYASRFLSTEYRRIRVEEKWLTDTLALPVCYR